MLDKLIIWAVQNRLLVVLSLIASIGAGLFIIQQLNLDAFQDFTIIKVTVITESQGLAAAEGVHGIA